MFIRVKTSNKGATKYVQIVQSIRKGERVTQKIVRHMGVAYDEDELAQLKLLAESIKIKLEAGGQQFLFKPEEIVNLKRSKEKYADSDYQVNLKNLSEEQRLISGIHEAYGRLFDDLGYRNIILNPARHQMAVRIFSDIVLARVANPVSKRASVELLEEDFGVTLDLDKVYRMMDRLDDKTIDRLKKITYQNTLNLFGGKIEVIFYDATTIYFESFTSDELKKCGYSKDNKSHQPQVLLALMVTKEGLPVDYQVFAGDTYEGHTLMPALTEIRKKYDIGRVVLVADSAMLSTDNISELESLEEGFEYIVGARLKNVGSKLKEEILDHDNYQEITPGYKIAHFTYQGKKLVVSYSAKRALKDADDRRKALEKLKKKLKKSSSPKEYLFNSGYRKYLKVEGKSNLYLNEEKIAASSKWDGLHGVITNANLSGEEILARYHDLWTVEDAFRVTKHDLAVRPVFHWKPRRIKAHMAICFAAYSLVKQMQHRVRLQYKNLSTEKIRQTLIRVQTSILFDQQKRIRYGLPSKMSKEARKIYSIFNIKRSMTPYIIEKCKM